jgi:hypothetical protein
MEPRNYSTIRSILKKEQGEKIAPSIFKVSNTESIKEYLDNEGITYEVYLEEPKGIVKKRLPLEAYQRPKKKRKIAER